MRSGYKLNMNLTFEREREITLPFELPLKVAYGRAAVKIKCQVHSWAGLPKESQVIKA